MARRGKKGGTGFHWEIDTLTEGLETLPEKADKVIAAAVAYHAPRVQSYARDNAPWNDQTSNARNGLFAQVSSSEVAAGTRGAGGRFVKAGKTHAIVLYHTVPYGIWLEVRWSGRLGIILPTIQSQGRELMSTVNNLLSRIR